ncbi:transporter [Paenibacillus peoriae]|uniref:lipopolysaccharide biosynthesis protein n=1 Tax=Paenibacillus peoriae TaxID=59893 RepID=UPI0032AF69C3
MNNRVRSLMFPLFNVLLNGFNFFFHIAASWYLTGQAYGQANALLALFALLSVLGLSIQLLTAKLVSKGDQKLALRSLPLGSLLLKAPLVLTVLAMIILLIFHPLLRSLLDVESGPLFMLYGLIGLHILVSSCRGDLQGRERMLALNVNYYIEVLGKLSLFFVLAALGLKLEALLLASCGGMLLSLLHGWIVSARGLSLFTYSGEHIPSGLWKSLGRDFTDSLMTNLFILFCISIDMLYVQHYFPEQASSYAIALKYSQLVYYVSYSLIAAFIPKIGAQGHDRQALGKLIAVYAGLMAVAATCVYVGTTFVFPSSIPILFGASYQSAQTYIPWGGWVYWLFSIVLFFVHVHVLVGRRKFMFSLMAGAAALLVAFHIAHTDPVDFLLSEFIVYGAMALYFVIDAYMHLFKIKIKGDLPHEYHT